jgi:hypothetical protein
MFRDGQFVDPVSTKLAAAHFSPSLRRWRLRCLRTDVGTGGWDEGVTTVVFYGPRSCGPNQIPPEHHDGGHDKSVRPVRPHREGKGAQSTETVDVLGSDLSAVADCSIRPTPQDRDTVTPRTRERRWLSGLVHRLPSNRDYVWLICKLIWWWHQAKVNAARKFKKNKLEKKRGLLVRSAK